MEAVSKILRYLKLNTEEIILLVLSLIFILLSVAAGAQSPVRSLQDKGAKIKADTSFHNRIQEQLNSGSSQGALYYPVALKHFYALNGFQPAWIKPGKDVDKTWQAMIMIDCVLQFGLSHDDYHPHDLLYNKLHGILETPEAIGNDEKVRFDILLTDAMIGLMNNLHFGRLNPDYPAGKVDGQLIHGFNAETILVKALQQPDLIRAIEPVQPTSKEYMNLQHYMQVTAGQQVGDCYEMPEGVLRKIAINLERLRWAEMNTETFIRINIPAYSLKFYQHDTTYLFKVIVGKPANPTPSLQSAIGYFTTAPEWKVPGKIFANELLPKALANSAYLENNHLDIYDKKGRWIAPTRANLLLVKQNRGNYRATQSSGCDNALGLVVFRFANIYDVYLHDTPEQTLFEKQARALSHGCVRCEQAEKLAVLMLQNDDSAGQIPAVHKAISTYTTKTFTLKNTLPIEVIYVTCEVLGGILNIYPDVYDLDNNLGVALFQKFPEVTQGPIPLIIK